MSTGMKFAKFAGMVVLCLGNLSLMHADSVHTQRKTTKKVQPPPPLPSGPTGPVQQIPLDSIAPVPPQVSYQDGQLTIVAPNSTLGDILRAVRKLTGAEMEIPANATERVVTNLGPGPAPFVVAALLNGSHFNYVLLGAPSDANTLTRVVLEAKSGPDTTPAPPAQTPVASAVSTPQPVVAETAPETADADADDADDNADQNAAETEPQPAPGTPADTAVKTPQQLLQEMQQRQLQMQQGQGLPGQQPGQPGQPPTPGGIIPPQRPPQQPPDQQ